MGKSKPSENKVKEPPKKEKKVGTKHRKGGKKVRKLAPMRRLGDAIGKFSTASNTLTEHKKSDMHHIQIMVELTGKALSRSELEDRLNRPRHLQVNPKKIARMLMPNGY